MTVLQNNLVFDGLGHGAAGLDRLHESRLFVQDVGQAAKRVLFKGQISNREAFLFMSGNRFFLLLSIDYKGPLVRCQAGKRFLLCGGADPLTGFS
jgi:hypothetical protein